MTPPSPWLTFLRWFLFLSEWFEVLALLFVFFAVWKIWGILTIVVEFISELVGGAEARHTLGPLWRLRPDRQERPRPGRLRDDLP